MSDGYRQFSNLFFSPIQEILIIEGLIISSLHLQQEKNIVIRFFCIYLPQILVLPPINF
jgi:hypothetical protein